VREWIATSHLPYSEVNTVNHEVVFELSSDVVERLSIEGTEGMGLEFGEVYRGHLTQDNVKVVVTAIKEAAQSIKNRVGSDRNGNTATVLVHVPIGGDVKQDQAIQMLFRRQIAQKIYTRPGANVSPDQLKTILEGTLSVAKVDMEQRALREKEVVTFLLSNGVSITGTISELKGSKETLHKELESKISRSQSWDRERNLKASGSAEAKTPIVGGSYSVSFENYDKNQGSASQEDFHRLVDNLDRAIDGKFLMATLTVDQLNTIQTIDHDRSETVMGSFEVGTLRLPQVLAFERSYKLVVSADTPEESVYASIQKAIQEAPAHSRLVIMPGLYRESIILNKPLVIEGQKREDVIVLADDDSCIRSSTESCVVRNLTLRGCAGLKGGKYFAVDIPRGRLRLEDCDITNDSLACIGIHGKGTDPLIKNCNIQKTARWGILIYDEAKGRIEDSQISCTNCGIEVIEKASPLVQRCTFEADILLAAFVNDASATFRNCLFRIHRVGPPFYKYRGAILRIKGHAHLSTPDCTVQGGDKKATLHHNAFASHLALIPTSAQPNRSDLLMVVFVNGFDEILSCWSDTENGVLLTNEDWIRLHNVKAYRDMDPGEATYQILHKILGSHMRGYQRRIRTLEFSGKAHYR
jgi:hypothetical protein